MLLPDNWQEVIVETRQRVEHRWSTPPLGATGRFVAEEAGEGLSILNRLANPELLRSTPLLEKDLPQRELGQTLCMVGTLATKIGLRLSTIQVTKCPTEMISAAYINLRAADVAYTVTVAEFYHDRVSSVVVGRILEEIVAHILILADQIGVDPYQGMIDFLADIEAKVKDEAAK